MKCGYATLRNVCSFKCLTLLHLSGLLQTDLDNAETGSGVRGFVTQPPRMFGYVWVVAEPGQLPSVATACHCYDLLWTFAVSRGFLEVFCCSAVQGFGWAQQR